MKPRRVEVDRDEQKLKTEAHCLELVMPRQAELLPLKPRPCPYRGPAYPEHYKVVCPACEGFPEGD